MNQADQLNDIAVKMGRMEVMQESNTKAIGDMATSLTRLVDKLDMSDDVAKEALLSATDAHRRINFHNKILYWAGTTIIGTAIAGGITYFIRSE